MSSKIKIVEIFYSIQGEGKFNGKPSIFIRSFGCTLNCPGFGNKEKINPEVNEIAAKHIENPYKNFKDLPLTKTGCDSYCSWHPAFVDLSKEMDSTEVLNEIKKIFNKNLNLSFENVDLVFTGGEPLLYQTFWMELCKDILFEKIPKINITFETNGTVSLNQTFIDYFKNNSKINLTFSVSPKMKNSGVEFSLACKPLTVSRYWYLAKENNFYFKFVIQKKKDIEELKMFLKYYEDCVKNEYDKEKVNFEVYLMPMGGCYNENYIKICKEVANFCIEFGFKYSPRLQVDLFKNEWGT